VCFISILFHFNTFPTAFQYYSLRKSENSIEMHWHYLSSVVCNEYDIFPKMRMERQSRRSMPCYSELINGFPNKHLLLSHHILFLRIVPASSVPHIFHTVSKLLCHSILYQNMPPLIFGIFSLRILTPFIL
jgi:hypothetical protein